MRSFLLACRSSEAARGRTSSAANCASRAAAAALWIGVLLAAGGCGSRPRETGGSGDAGAPSIVEHDARGAGTATPTPTPTTARTTAATTDLRRELERLTSGFRGTAGVYVRRLPDGDEIAIRADEVFPTASLVKVPILLRLLERVDAKEVSWTEHLTFERSRISPGEDLLARFADGQKITVPELVFLMLAKSDNTASLWCQELAGGGVAINDWLARKGYAHTRVNSKTPGREADRTAMPPGRS